MRAAAAGWVAKSRPIEAHVNGTLSASPTLNGNGTVALGTGRVPPRALATPASIGRRIHSGSVTGPYLLLVVGALAATAVSTLLRRKAVQST